MVSDQAKIVDGIENVLSFNKKIVKKVASSIRATGEGNFGNIL